MRHSIAALLIAGLIAPAPSLAARPPAGPTILAAKERAAADGRAVLVELGQTAIGTDVEIGRVISDSVYGGGLLGALILSSQDKKREALASIEAQKAEAAVAPLRQALQDFDLAPLATATSSAGLARLDWFGAREPRLTRIASEGERLGFAAIAGTAQHAVIGYHYGLSPDFTQIRVVAEITLLRKAGKGEKAGPGGLVLLARQRVMSIAELPKRSYEHGENVKAWSADNARLARAALTAAFARLETEIPRALAMTAADLAGFEAKNQPKGFAAGFYGPVVERASDGSGAVTIWSKGLISVIPAALPASPSS
jgi:hypothetical protein